jgi:integrase
VQETAKVYPALVALATESMDQERKEPGVALHALAFRPVDRHGHIGVTRLSAPAVALVLKLHAARAGLDPAEVAGHSLRAGLATSAAAAGVPERVIAEQTGHKGTAMLRRYIREGSLFRENATGAVGL